MQFRRRLLDKYGGIEGRDELLAALRKDFHVYTKDFDFLDGDFQV